MKSNSMNAQQIAEKSSAIIHAQDKGQLTGVYQTLVTDSSDKLVAIFSGKSFSRKQAIFSD